MSTALHDEYEIRSWFDVVQEVEHERGPRSADTLIKAASAVIIRNPFAGRFVEDLSPLTSPSALLGEALGKRARALLGGRPVEGYGKGGIAGLDGEQEHVVACVTTVFGDAFRAAVGGGGRGSARRPRPPPPARRSTSRSRSRTRSTYAHTTTRSRSRRLTVRGPTS